MKKVNEILGYEDVLDIYLVSPLGYVYSEKLQAPLKESDNGKGYLQVRLKQSSCRKYKHAYVHRLVAQAFVENPLGNPEVNHIDEDKTNNQADNLEWVTRLENVRYGTGTARQIRTRCYDVFVYDALLRYVGKFIGLNRATISTLGYSDTKGINRRVQNFFYLDKPIEVFSKEDFLDIVDRSLYRTIVIENVHTGEKKFFNTNREARRFFDGKVNVTDAIKYKWLVRKTFRISNLNYSELIDSPNLRES